MKIIAKRLTIPEWLEYVARYDFGPVAPDRLVMHHTWKPVADQWYGSRSIAGLKTFYEKKGWSAGPHIFVAPDGIWLFTPMSEIGVHAGAGNSGHVNGRLWYSIGMETVGDFDRERPSGVVWEEAKAVMGGLCRRLGIPTSKIYFHRDFSTKTCPGSAVTKDWVHAEVDVWLAPRPVPVQKAFHVMITARPRLRVRQGPSTEYPQATDQRQVPIFVDFGTLHECDVTKNEGQGDWYRLVTGAGFVSGEFAVKT